MGEVGVPDRFSCLKKNLAPRQIDDLKVRFKPREVFWLQSGEEPVASVKGSLGTILHGKVSPYRAVFRETKSGISAG